MDYYIILSEDQRPQDTVSSITWCQTQLSPFSNERKYIFACSSWDSKIRFYDISETSKSINFISSLNIEHPCLSLAYRRDDYFLAAGCIDNSVKNIDLSTGQSTNIGHHDDAVKDVHWIDDNLVISSSFGKILKIWDIRTENRQPVKEYRLNYKIFCSDFKGNVVALGLQGSRSIVFNYMHSTQTILSDQRHYFPSPFNEEQELGCIALFHDLQGFSVGSIAGRADISQLCEMSNGSFTKSKIISFVCHSDNSSSRDPTAIRKLYPVNAMALNPALKHNMLTAGSDGKLMFWDFQTKNRNSILNTGGTPITKAVYSPDGKFAVFATGYDWSSGIEKSMLYKTNITAHIVTEKDILGNQRR